MAQNIFNPQVISTTNTYAGNDSVNRAIPHGLNRIPNLVLINTGATAAGFSIVQGNGKIVSIGTGTNAVTAMDTANFYVGNATSYANSANATGTTYYWSAI
jgi:hypothetical protein